MIWLVVKGRRSESFTSGRGPCGSNAVHLLACTLGWLLAAAVVMVSASPIHGASGTGEGQSARRYLFVVESSRAMQKRAQGVHDTLKALLDSNLSGQMQPNDSVAVWTFNEAISTN